MSVEFYREPPGKFDSRTLSRKTLNRWTGRVHTRTPAQKEFYKLPEYFPLKGISMYKGYHLIRNSHLRNFPYKGLHFVKDLPLEGIFHYKGLPLLRDFLCKGCSFIKYFP